MKMTGGSAVFLRTRLPSVRGASGILLLSLALQFALGLFFGHAYDMRIFMATGYLVATGQDPYLPQDLSRVFHTLAFQGLTSVGYPPPWPLMLGLIYRISFAVVPNLLLYNLAIKVPIILSNVGLGLLVVYVLRKLGAGEREAGRAWAFLLLNPFVLYVTAAWGQFDSIVALCALASLVILEGKPTYSALLLALAVSFKPIALPILPVALAFLWTRSASTTLKFAGAFLGGLLAFCVLPFVLWGWDPTPILRNWNAHFTVAGGLSWLSALEALRGSVQLPGRWWLLGLAWVPAIGLASLWLRSGVTDLLDLLRKSAGLILVFYLTRAWLSEPNIVLLLPMVIVLVATGDLPRLALGALWVLPLIFTVFNTSPPQLLFPAFPDAMHALLAAPANRHTLFLILRSVMVIPWQIAGWWIVVACLGRRKSAVGSTVT